jgi:hypothetical protein
MEFLSRRINVKYSYLLAFFFAAMVCALPVRAELDWMMRLDQPPLRVSPHDIVTITGTLINKPESTENLGVFTTGPSGPPGDYNMAVFLGICPGWTFEVNGVHFVQQFVGVDLAPGETFDFILGQCIPPEQGYPTRSFSGFGQLQLVSVSLGRQVGTSTDYVRWIVSDEIQQAIGVEIIVNPSGNTGAINVRSDAPISIAILSSSMATGAAADFDATQVDPGSIKFGPLGVSPAAENTTVEDINGDGLMDLVVRFSTQDTALSCSNSAVTLEGETFDGRPFVATTAITPFGCGRP